MLQLHKSTFSSRQGCFYFLSYGHCSVYVFSHIPEYHYLFQVHTSLILEVRSLLSVAAGAQVQFQVLVMMNNIFDGLEKICKNVTAG